MIEYMVRVTCDECGSADLFDGSHEALDAGWSITSNDGDWLCPLDSRLWREKHATTSEPTDEELLS